MQGVALAGVAAQSLQRESGIAALTIASWLSHARVDNKTVVIIDEAGMVGSKQMSDIVQKVQQAGAKLVLVGDERQLQPIAAGGILHAIDTHVAKVAPQYSTAVEDIKRQREEWMKEVVKAAAQGKTGEALETLEKKGKIDFYSKAAEARQAVADEFIEKNRKDFSKGIVLTNFRQDADKINLQIRDNLKDQGIVDTINPIVINNGTKEIGIAAGDRLMFTRNDYDLDIRNGQRATVTGVDPFRIIEVRLDNGEQRRIHTDAYNHIDYGWAATTHKAQGATVENALVFGYSSESMASQQATYVQISRARQETKLFIVAGERGVERDGTKQLNKEQRQEALKEMKQSWSHNAAKDTTLEHKQVQRQKELIRERTHERES